MALPLAALVVVAGIFLLIKRRDDLWILFALAIAIGPAATILIVRPLVLYERYFLMPLVLVLVLLALLLSQALRARIIVRSAAALALLAILTANVLGDARLIREGRGHYRAALEYIATHSKGNRIVIGSDQDFRNFNMIKYYSRFVHSSKFIEYRRNDQWPVGGPEWLILHDQNENAVPDQSVSDSDDNTYDLAASYRYAGLSGWSWFVYRNHADSSP